MMTIKGFPNFRVDSSQAVYDFSQAVIFGIADQ